MTVGLDVYLFKGQIEELYPFSGLLCLISSCFPGMVLIFLGALMVLINE